MHTKNICTTIAAAALATACSTGTSSCGFPSANGVLGTAVKDTCNPHATGCIEPTSGTLRYAKDSTFVLSAEGVSIALIVPGVLSYTTTGDFRAERTGTTSLLLRKSTGELSDYVDATVEDVTHLSLSEADTDIWNYENNDTSWWKKGMPRDESLLLVNPSGPSGLMLGGLLKYSVTVDMPNAVKLETRGRLVHLTTPSCSSVATTVRVSLDNVSTSRLVTVPPPQSCGVIDAGKPDAPRDGSPDGSSDSAIDGTTTTDAPLLDGGNDAN